MILTILWAFINVFYIPAYFFFGLVNLIFSATAIGKDQIASCQIASILYIPVWLVIFAIVYYILHRTRKFETELMFISRYRHVFLFLYAFVVLWMYSIPVGCEHVWELVPGNVFVNRGMPMQFSGSAFTGIMVQYPFITLFYTEIPSHRVMWYIPNMLTNFAIILGITYIVYWKLKYIPHHLRRHTKRRNKK